MRPVTRTLGLGHVAGFSSAVFPQDVEPMFSGFITDPERASTELRLLWLGCGADDGLLAGNQILVKALSDKGIKHDWIVTKGYAHTWTLWRRYLRDLLPRLFAETA